MIENNYLFIGPRKNNKDFKKIGGIIVLFENLLSYCDENNIKYAVIDTNKLNYINKFLAYIQILFLLIIKTSKSTHVSLHGTANDFLFIAPFALIISKVLKKNFTLRKFAGNFINVYNNYTVLNRFIIRMILKQSSSNFFETKYLVNYFKQYNKNTYIFPNVRDESNFTTTKSFNKKFIYLGAIKQEKGIDILCKASNLLSKGLYQIDLYGMLYDGYSESYFNDFQVKYKGTLNSENVMKVLSTYDVLILPSFREGYPGVIVEAFAAGLPVIATNLGGISEMVNQKSSILVEPMNVLQLKEAIEFFDASNYRQKSIAALENFNSFNSKIQTKKYFAKISIKENSIVNS